MKRIGILIICLCLVFTGCQRDKTKDETNETITESLQNPEATTPTPVAGVVEEGAKELSLDTDWTSVDTAKLTKVPYVIPNYEAKVPAYKIAQDLSNIKNIDQFSGFSEEQIKKLVGNGFVVVPTQSTKMYYTYDSNEYSGVPNFITSDTVLHLYHQFYDKTLINVESSFLYDDLELMTKQMLDKSILLLNTLEDEKLKELQKNNVVYFLVARMLMLQSTALAVEVDAELMNIAKQEYELSDKASGIELSPLINKEVDYSQFTVRGHYTRTEELGKFFRTMMWFGTFPYAFYSRDEYQYDNVLKSLLIAYMTFAKSEQISDAELWSNIYVPTSSYVGLSDDIDVFTMNKLRKEVFGDMEDPNAFNDEKYYSRLELAVKALPEPKIQGKMISSTLQTEKQFRFMGQRYILDSDILQDLITPIVRPIPSGLDVMGVLGSGLAEQLQFEVYQPQEKWPEYTIHYKEWKDKVAALNADFWATNLYTGWLWTLQTALTEYDKISGMPFFMTTQAWKNKALSTALGSYTELKHDTVLYGKQAIAEMGGPIEYADYHYVEPEVVLYMKLYYLTDYTISILKERGMLNESLMRGADEYKELLQFLITCSTKELNNEPLTEEENDQLLRYGGSMESIATYFLNGIVDEDYPNIEISDMLVSDISSAPGAYLTLGTGYFDQIYVVVPVNGSLYLSRGSVYSHYEFTSTSRLTDEQWWELNGIKVIHQEYADFPEINEPSEQLPKQPEWINTFKSDSNNVTITPLEVDWEKLNE
ncbi:MAG: hypothetical protein K0R46_2135 [Herbinix sp.]|nr:hypothetical protein [Herbinix sp.]